MLNISELFTERQAIHLYLLFYPGLSKSTFDFCKILEYLKYRTIKITIIFQYNSVMDIFSVFGFLCGEMNVRLRLRSIYFLFRVHIRHSCMVREVHDLFLNFLNYRPQKHDEFETSFTQMVISIKKLCDGLSFCNSKRKFRR